VEQTDGGSVKRYLRGINLLAGEADGMVYYYIQNEHGDVSQLWGQSGTCKSSYEYDAFGNERKPEKGDENPFRYCGEYLDLETNTYYLRARSYRSETGRFLTEDSVESVARKMPNGQEITDPLSLNKYTYCHNNPIFHSDPTGHFALPFMAITGIAGAIAGALTGAITSALKGKFSWKEVGEGALIGAAIGLTGGAAVSLLTTGSAFAATGTVMGALGFGAGATTVGTLGAAEFEQARQLLERSGSTIDKQIVSTVAPQASQAMQNTSQIFQNGGVYETTMKLKDGNIVDAIAEVVVDGQHLLLNHIAIYPRGGDIPNQVGYAAFKQLTHTVQSLAYQGGFTTLRLYGERVFNSTSANPGMVIDRTFDLLKIFGGK